MNILLNTQFSLINLFWKCTLEIVVFFGKFNLYWPSIQSLDNSRVCWPLILKLLPISLIRMIKWLSKYQGTEVMVKTKYTFHIENKQQLQIKWFQNKLIKLNCLLSDRFIHNHFSFLTLLISFNRAEPLWGWTLKMCDNQGHKGCQIYWYSFHCRYVLKGVEACWLILKPIDKKWPNWEYWNVSPDSVYKSATIEQQKSGETITCDTTSASVRC